MVLEDAWICPACSEGGMLLASAAACNLTLEDVAGAVELPGVADRTKLTVVAPVAKWVNCPVKVTVTFCCPLFVEGDTPLSMAIEGT